MFHWSSAQNKAHLGYPCYYDSLPFMHWSVSQLIQIFDRSVGRSFSQSIKWSNRQPASWSVVRLVDRSVSQSSGYSVIRSIGQSASQCEKIVVLASKFRFLEFLVLKTCRLKACACTCADSGSAAIEIDSARKLLWHVVVHTSNSFFNASLSYPRRSHSPRKPISNGNQGSW